MQELELQQKEIVHQNAELENKISILKQGESTLEQRLEERKVQKVE